MKMCSKHIGVIAFIAVIAFSIAACDDSNGNNGGGNLVNSSGEAWVSIDEGMGYIFRSNGTFDAIYDDWGIWEVEESGKYSTKGNKVTLTFQETPSSSYSVTVTYSVSGNTLKITYSQSGYSETHTFTKMKINVGVWNAPSNHTPLINGQWMDGNINSYGGINWYTFTVTAGTTYYVWWNDSYDGDYNKTLDIMVSAFENNGNRLFDYVDSGWSSPRSFTATVNGVVYLRVAGYDDETGTFAIVYSTGSTRP